MEYTQWGILYYFLKSAKGLNPCCNGIYSMSNFSYQKKYGIISLNPCCNGIYSMSTSPYTVQIHSEVLILVVMEYTQWELLMRFLFHFGSLNPCCNGIYSMRIHIVITFVSFLGLNPCCNGIYSMRTCQRRNTFLNTVLILVVMEYTQWDVWCRASTPI